MYTIKSKHEQIELKKEYVFESKLFYKLKVNNQYDVKVCNGFLNYWKNFTEKKIVKITDEIQLISFIKDSIDVDNKLLLYSLISNTESSFENKTKVLDVCIKYLDDKSLKKLIFMIMNKDDECLIDYIIDNTKKRFLIIANQSEQLLPIICKNKLKDTTLKLLELYGNKIYQYDVDNDTLEQNTCLIYAVKNNYTDIVKKIIEIGGYGKNHLFDIDHHAKQTILHTAAEHNNLELVKILVNICDLETEDINHITALMSACTNGYDDTALCLLEKGADYNKLTKSGYNIIDCVAKYNLKQVLDKIIQLGKYEHMINRIDKNNGYNSLCYATQAGNDDIGLKLFELGSDYKVHDNLSLYYASSRCPKTAVKILENEKCNYWDMDEDNNTPLFLACETGHDNVVETILNKKDFEEKNKDNLFKIIISALSHDIEDKLILKLITITESIQNYNLYKIGIDGDTLLTFACKHKRNIIAINLHESMNWSKSYINTQNKDNMTALKYACLYNMKDVEAELCEILNS